MTSSVHTICVNLKRGIVELSKLLEANASRARPAQAQE